MSVMQRRAMLLAIPACAFLGVGCVNISAVDSRYVETVEKRFTVSGTPTVRLGTFDGSVEVDSWDRPEVLVVIEKHALDKTAADRMSVTATRDGDLIDVEVRDERAGGFNLTLGSHGARLRVSVPARAHIEASTGDGRVAVRKVAGDLTIRTGDGAIELEQVNGAVDATSGDGSVEIDGVIHRLATRSGDGRVLVRSAPGYAPTADWSIATGDGSVILEVADGFGAELDATTGDGRVTVNDLPFSRAGEERSRRVARGRIGAGGPNVRIRSGDGSIVVRPSEAAPPS